MIRLDDMPDVLTIAEVARYLRIGRNTAYSMAKRHTLPTVSMGRRLLVPKRALMKFLDSASTRVALQ